MKLFVKFSICLISLSFIGCGSDQNSKLASDEEGETPLLVIMGGNNSCDRHNSPENMGMYEPFQALKAKLNTHHSSPIPFLVSCYDDGGNTIYYISSATNGQIQEVNREGMVNDLIDLIGQTSNPKVILAGHSYGGWLSLKISQDLFATSIPSHALFSIDPISRVSCTYSSPMNCTSAPDDISSGQYDDIASNTATWINFYQTQTFYLHSSAIRAATQNLKIATSHTAIDNHTAVWQKINEVVGEVPSQGVEVSSR